MKKQIKESRYVSSICVWVGRVNGLLDMLRYDSCYPASESESWKIERLMSNRAEPADHYIRLMRVALNSNGPTVERWASFDCLVLDVRSPREAPPTDADLIRMAEGAR